jgi:hypothetical protein
MSRAVSGADAEDLARVDRRDDCSRKPARQDLPPTLDSIAAAESPPAKPACGWRGGRPYGTFRRT